MAIEIGGNKDRQIKVSGNDNEIVRLVKMMMRKLKTIVIAVMSVSLLLGFAYSYADTMPQDDIPQQDTVVQPTVKATAPQQKVVTTADRREAEMYYQQSQTLSAEKKPKEALVAINHALALDPDNIKYLRTRAELASWVDDMHLMLADNEQILRLRPNDPTALRNAADAESRLGDRLDRASTYYKRYLALKPSDKQAYLDYASVEIWQEDYPRAKSILEEYRQRFGDTKEYYAHLARLYASAGWYDEALALNQKAVSKGYPKDYEYFMTQAYAFQAAHRNKEMLDSVDQLMKLQPNSEETRVNSLEMVTPLRSSITVGAGYSYDTQVVQVFQTPVAADIYLTPDTRFLVHGLYEYLRASANSGVLPITGGNSTYDTSGTVGLSHRLSQYISVEGNVGALYVKQKSTRPIFNVGTTVNLSPRASVQYTFSRDLFRPDQIRIFSPRSVSFPIMQNANLLHLHFEPWLDNNWDIYGNYTHLSDGNNMGDVVVWPKIGIIRRHGSLTLDAGLRGELLSFSRQLSNGYYSPKFSQLYLATLTGYYGITHNTGVSIYLAGGINKDETYSHFYPAGDVSAELIMGLYQDWQLVPSISYSYRGAPGTPYQVTTAMLSLTRRF